MVSLKKTDLDKMTELQYVLWMVKTYGSLHTSKHQLISLAITRHCMTDVKGRRLLITA